MPSKKRLLRKMVHPWFQNCGADQLIPSLTANDSSSPTEENFPVIQEFEQEFIDWLLNALRDSDSIKLREELLNNREKIDGKTLRELLQFRVAQENHCGQEEGEENGGGGNGMDFVVQDEGEAGGHQGLHLKSNNELDESEVIDGRNGQSAEESINNNYSNLVVGQDSLKWFAEDGKSTIRKRPSTTAATTRGGQQKNVVHFNDIQRLLSEFRKHQRQNQVSPSQSTSGNRRAESDESGIDETTVRDIPEEEEEDDVDVDANSNEDDLDKTLVAEGGSWEYE